MSGPERSSSMGRKIDAGRLLFAGDAALAFDPDLERARRVLEAYEPPDAAQAEIQERMLAFIGEHPRDAHLRSSLTGHLTAAALVLDAERRRALLTHHKKLERWLQLGGHCDGDANLAAVALREAREESGIEGLGVLPEIVDLDIHTIPARAGEPEHLHLDVRFLVLAPKGAMELASQESHELRWFAPGELVAIHTDESVHRLFRLGLDA